MTMIHLGRDECGSFERGIEREWLVTNGLGGFASGTICETNTRRYHGLLIAALSPPVARTLLVAAVDATVRYGADQYRLFTNEFGDGTIDPTGYRYLESFHLEAGIPVWHYAIADALIEKRVLMQPGRNTTCLSLRVLRASAMVEIDLVPLCTYRDYHSQGHGGWQLGVQDIQDGIEITAFPGAQPYRITCTDTAYVHDPAWHWNYRHREESARGLDDREDLFRPGRFTCQLSQGQHITIVLSADPDSPATVEVAQTQIQERQSALLQRMPSGAPEWVRLLTLAADQFIVDRHKEGRPVGKTVIAGYPWFSDWGRDTMIALPGLTLTTQRFEEATSILRTFARHISEGMLPNRFPDSAEPPEYNTVDATLWYFNAIDQYTKRSGDRSLVTELYPLLTGIIDWHRRGTRYGIKVDHRDGLLAAGENGVQLTWMDAKVGDWVVTPRIGKAVEVNALWYNALRIMASFSSQLGKDTQVTEYQDAATQVKASFQRFWNAARGCLFDVIDGPEGEPGTDGQNYDGRLRPNQLFAVALPHSPLESTQQKSVVDICARELLTSHGLRSLARGEPGYVSHYQGNPLQRDGAYHQGTVWAWLIGPFVEAHYRVYQDAPTARSFLEPLGQHLSAACLGSISEVFDGDPPFSPRGCVAQAWSVSEVLRVWKDLHEH